MAAVRGRRHRRRLIGTGVTLALAASAAIAIYVQRHDAPATPGAVPAATVVAVIGIAGASIAPHSVAAGQTVLPGATISTRDDLRVVLRTGAAQVRLDTGTEAAVIASGVMQLRAGALYVDADGAQAQSIEVRTPYGIARDVGTRFELRLIDGGLRVRVRDGLVQWERAGSHRTAAAGTELLARAAGVPTARAVSAFGDDWAWVLQAAPPFSIDGQRLEAFLAWVARETGWRITFETPQLQARSAGIILSGNVDDLALPEALHAVLTTCSLEYTERDGVVTIQPAAGGTAR